MLLPRFESLADAVTKYTEQKPNTGKKRDEQPLNLPRIMYVRMAGVMKAVFLYLLYA